MRSEPRHVARPTGHLTELPHCLKQKGIVPTKEAREFKSRSSRAKPFGYVGAIELDDRVGNYSALSCREVARAFGNRPNLSGDRTTLDRSGPLKLGLQAFHSPIEVQHERVAFVLDRPFDALADVFAVTSECHTWPTLLRERDWSR